MKVAIVTGATKGIGKVISLKLAELKYDLVVVGRSEGLLKDLAKEIEQKSVQCLPINIDLTHSIASEKIVKETLARFGQVDLLINNAGLAYSASIMETDAEIWDDVFRLNVKAPFFLCKAVIPELKKSNHPIIINIGSVVGFKGYEKQAVYAASKHALTGFTKVLAKEVQKDGINVHWITPGGVNTEMVQQMRPDINGDELIQPEEIAELVEFLVTRKGKGTIDHFYIRRQSGLAFD